MLIHSWYSPIQSRVLGAYFYTTEDDEEVIATMTSHYPDFVMLPPDACYRGLVEEEHNGIAEYPINL